MKKQFILAAVVATVGGTALHFLYDVLPNPLVALFAPVNESVWEHLKLLYWPTLAAALALSPLVEDKLRLWSGFLTALAAMPLFLLGLYYLLGALGVKGLWVDIALYYVTMGGGFWLAWYIGSRGRLTRAAPWLLMAVILYGAFLILFTFAAPDCAIFRAPPKTAALWPRGAVTPSA